MTDKPIAITADGRPLYDNTPTVVCVIVPVAGGVLAIRRAQAPGKGKLGLPGGYHMRGEAWQECGCREVREETGVHLRPECIHFISMDTDKYGNNLIICIYKGDARTGLLIIGSPLDPDESTGLRVAYGIDGEDWAFPRHRVAVEQFLR